MKTALPADIAAASDEEIAAAEAELIAEFDAAIDAGSTDVALMTEIATAIESIRTEAGARSEARAAAAAEVAALAERVHAPAAEIADEPSEAVEPETETADEAVEEATEAEEATTEERELVTASADKTTPKAPSASAVARRSPAPAVQKAAPEIVITAAADIPGTVSGSSISKLDLAKAFHAKARTLSNQSGYIPVASINLPIEHKLGADLAQNLDVLEKATAPSALTAAGWCAPSQNLYTLFGLDSADGLIDLPTVQITRGGLNVPAFIGYDNAVENGGLWTWTEADSDDGYSTKPCVQIPCPTFEDYRLEAEGICVTNGNLTDRAFPELTQRYVDLVVNTHLHRVSGAVINKIVASADVEYLTGYQPDTSAAGRVLNAIDVQVADYRSRYRMGVASVLEAIFPLWTKAMLRSDLAMRHGVDLLAVTDAMIDEYFRVRGVRAQFVHDFYPMAGNAPTTGYSNAAAAWPTAFNFVIFPAGGYVKGDGGTIDLGVVRDSVLNATNDYTAAWSEQMYLVAQLGPKARLINFPIVVDGVTACCDAPVL